MPDKAVGDLGFETDVPTRPEGGPDVTSLSLTTQQYFILSRVDGKATLREICFYSGIPFDNALVILRELHDSRLVDLPNRQVPPRQEDTTDEASSSKFKIPNWGVPFEEFGLPEVDAEADGALSEEMRRLLKEQPRKVDSSIGGIPVDSEYIIFIIDTSGSMQRYSWSLVQKKLRETLEVYPKVKGLQIMNDMGEYMFSQYRGKWIPDTPARRMAIISRLSTWRAFSNSSPVEGITAAIKTFYSSDKKISLYVFGDEFSGQQMQPVIDEVDRINKMTSDGSRRVRIHAVGFPVVLEQTRALGNTGDRFATLMRTLCQKNGGTFVGLNSTRP